MPDILLKFCLVVQAYLAAWLQSEHFKSGRDNHTLLLVVWGRDTLKHLQAVQSLLASECFVRQHS